MAENVQEWQRVQWAAGIRVTQPWKASQHWYQRTSAPVDPRYQESCACERLPWKILRALQLLEVDGSVLMDYLEEDVDPGKLLRSSLQGQVWSLQPWKKSFTRLRKKIAENCQQQERNRIAEL